MVSRNYTEERQVVAGIGTKYAPEALIGKRIVLVANLQPAKIMGVESQGMLLAAGAEEVLELATFLEEIPPGTRIKYVIRHFFYKFHHCLRTALAYRGTEITAPSPAARPHNLS